jgi:hypothetical protein
VGSTSLDSSCNGPVRRDLSAELLDTGILESMLRAGKSAVSGSGA